MPSEGRSPANCSRGVVDAWLHLSEGALSCKGLKRLKTPSREGVGDDKRMSPSLALVGKCLKRLKTPSRGGVVDDQRMSLSLVSVGKGSSSLEPGGGSMLSRWWKILSRFVAVGGSAAWRMLMVKAEAEPEAERCVQRHRVGCRNNHQETVKDEL
jgi:hypothetical protein